MKDFRRWLESRVKTPAECTRKRKLLVVAKGRDGGDDWQRGIVRLNDAVSGRPAALLWDAEANNLGRRTLALYGC